MTNNSSEPAAKKVKYIASILYLLVFAFIVAGTYINQQNSSAADMENTVAN